MPDTSELPGFFTMRFVSGRAVRNVLFIILGLALIIASGLILFFSGYFQTQRYVEGHCSITSKQLSSQIQTNTDKKNNVTGTTTVYAPSFTYTVRTADGHLYTSNKYEYNQVYTNDKSGQQAILDRYQINGVYPCWYYPQNPSQAVLVRNTSPFFFFMAGGFLVVGLIFFSIGILLILGIIRNTSYVIGRRISRGGTF